jgi:hypothetical protein
LAALVARDHQLTDLVAQLGIDRRGGEPPQLGLDIERLLAAADQVIAKNAAELTALALLLKDNLRAVASGTTPSS